MSDFLVFDLETQRSALEVGGWHNIAEMKMSVGVVWDSNLQKYCIYYEDKVKDLIDHLTSGPRVIGYNHIGFDYTVLSGYYSDGQARTDMIKKFKELNNLDLLNDLKDRIGKRIKLDAVARPTLKVGKSADGLMALKWYKEYLQGDTKKLEEIAKYCQQDVEVTRDVYLFGIENKFVFYEDKESGIQKITVDWQEEIVDQEEEDSFQLSF